jgi:hypothetical protein
MKFSASRFELDSMIREIELTLVSIIQGVALTVLIENTHSVISQQQFFFWPYIAAGLLVIFVFWSRAVLHIITVIRWPLEFGHNFLYIACALVEAVLFTQIGKPAAWFGFGAAFIAIGWTLFVYDLRLIHARMRDSAGPLSNQLSLRVLRDQWLNIGVLLPAMFCLNLFCAIVVQSWPKTFVNGNAHIWLIGLQLAGFAGYLYYVVRFYVDLAPLIAQARSEWRGSADSNEQS